MFYLAAFAASLVNRHVQFLSLDALSFHAPVPIGAMLQLSSQIVYTSEPEQHPHGHTIAGVTVLAEVVDLETGERKKSNTVRIPPSPPRVSATSPLILPVFTGSITVPLQLRPRHNQSPSAAADVQGGHGVHRGQATCRSRHRNASSLPGRPSRTNRRPLKIRIAHPQHKASFTPVLK